MKKLKRVLPIFLLVAVLLAMTGCGQQAALEDEEIYKQKSDNFVATLTAMDKEEVEQQLTNLQEGYEDFEQQVALYPYLGGSGQKFDFTAEAYLSLLKSYASNMDDFGDYIGVKEYEGGKVEANGVVSYSTVYDFSDHDMRLTLAYNKDQVVTTVTMDPIYSSGEIAKKAGLNTILGMGSVFCVLVLLCFIISCFKYISVFEEKMRNRGVKEAAPAAKPVEAPAPAPAVVEEVDPADDLQLVAVITAAIAAASDAPTDGFVVRSIRRRSTNKWKKS